MTNFNYSMTEKAMTMTKIKALAKADAITTTMDLLKATFGENNVAIVRTGASSQVNEIAVKVGTVEDEDGFPYDLCMTLNPQIKDFKERKTATKTFEPFDFEESKAEYERYISEKAEKAEKAKEAKAKKIASDEKARAKKALDEAKNKGE
jgi:hypothetical protein